MEALNNQNDKNRYAPENNMKFTYKKVLASMSVAALLTMTSQANAGLIKSLDNNLIYDDVSNVTWLADVLYAKTSGFDADSKMTWANSDAWADGLNAFGFSDWRLATLDEGLSLQDVGQNTSLFSNTDPASHQFWTSTVSTTNADKLAWFRLDGSSNVVIPGTSNKYAWAVTDGDVAGLKVNVPEPGTMAMFSVALAGLAYRRKKLKSDK